MLSLAYLFSRVVAFEIAKVSYARFACDESFCVFEELF